MWAAGMAWLVSAAPVERRGELIGAALSAAIVGVLLGPVLGGAATVLSPEAVFSAVSVVAVVLGAWAWSMPGVEPEASPGIRAMLRTLRRPAVMAGFWLFTIPALFAGVIEVLVPLRMDDLGAAGRGHRRGVPRRGGCRGASSARLPGAGLTAPAGWRRSAPD